MDFINKEDLERMKQVDVRTVDPETLVDITDVKIDESLPKEQRFADFLRQIKKPYCFRCGQTVVKLNFADTDTTLEDCLKRYLRSL